MRCKSRLFHSILSFAPWCTSPVVRETGTRTLRVAGERRCTRSHSLYVSPLSLWVSFGLLIIFWVYGLPSGLHLCVSFWWMSSIWSFGFRYKVISDGRGEVCFAQWAREYLWQENQFRTYTATQLGGGPKEATYTEIPGWHIWSGRWQVYSNIGMMQTNWTSGGVCR